MPVLSGHDYADYKTRRANNYVEKLCYDAYVDTNGETRVEFGLLPATLATGIMSGVTLAANVRNSTFVSTFLPERDMGRWGRNVVASAAVTVRGRDWLGQPMTEDVTATGKKAFFFIDSVLSVAGGAGVNLGWGNVLGFPYAIIKLTNELVDDAPLAAGTLVACLPVGTVQTAITGDPRGTYLPAAGGIPNNARNVVVTGICMSGQLHGIPHFYS